MRTNQTCFQYITKLNIHKSYRKVSSNESIFYKSIQTWLRIQTELYRQWNMIGEFWSNQLQQEVTILTYHRLSVIQIRLISLKDGIWYHNMAIGTCKTVKYPEVSNQLIRHKISKVKKYHWYKVVSKQLRENKAGAHVILLYHSIITIFNDYHSLKLVISIATHVSKSQRTVTAEPIRLKTTQNMKDKSNDIVSQTYTYLNNISLWRYTHTYHLIHMKCFQWAESI